MASATNLDEIMQETSVMDTCIEATRDSGLDSRIVVGLCQEWERYRGMVLNRLDSTPVEAEGELALSAAST